MSAEPWRCDVHALTVPDGDCPKCDDELIALAEQAAQDEPGVRIQLDTVSEPATCMIWHDGVLIFDGIARKPTSSNPADLPATPGPVDWDSPTWGGGRHEAAWAPDGTHDDNAQDD